MFLRLLIGLPFVYFLSGFPLAKLFLPKEKTLSLKLILTSFSFSLFLTYPAAVLTTMIEGQSAQAIYSTHLPISLFSLGVLFLISLMILFIFQKDWAEISLSKVKNEQIILGLIILIYGFFVFWNLGRADILGDDYDLAYQAYNLHDGVLDARKAYVLSFGTHPPLMMTIKHFGMQLFSPFGLETLSDWMFRGIEGMMGIGIILGVYLFVRDFFSQKQAYLAALFLAVNNYLIFFGRYFEREIYLTFFLVMASYFFLKDKLYLAALFLGMGLLTKASAFLLLPPIILFLIFKNRIRDLVKFMGIVIVIYLPVIFFNIAAYVLTGYMDGNFSRIFNLPHPYLPPVGQRHSAFVPLGLFYLLADLYSWPVFGLFITATGSLILNKLFKQKETVFLIVWLLVSLIFFSFSSVIRSYYLLPITIPLVIFASIFLTKVFSNRFVIAGFVGVSILYAFNTNLVTPRLSLKYDDVGVGGDYHLFVDNFWSRSFSLAAASFSQERGWKYLKPELEKIAVPGGCLERAFEVSDFPVRRYLETDDLVKETLIGKNYFHNYLMCREVPDRSNKIQIYYNENTQVSLKTI